jgi:hypothetical protein
MPGVTEIHYDYGYSLGYVKDDKVRSANTHGAHINVQTYVNNHLSFVLHYHEHTAEKYRVVGFEVIPRSIDYGTGKWPVDGCPKMDQVRRHARAHEHFSYSFWR